MSRIEVGSGRGSAAEHFPITGSARPGIAYVAAFLLMANANAVFSGNLLQSLHPIILLFWSFLVTSVFFNTGLLLGSGRRALAIDRPSAGALSIINATSALNWIGYYYALRFIEPAIVSALMGGLGPLSTIALERIVRGRQLPARTYVAGSGILLGAALLAWASLSGLSGLKGISLSDSVIGLTAATIGGGSQALNTIAAKQLGDRGWTATRIMAHRFYLLIAVAALLAATGPGFWVDTAGQAGGVAIATVLGVIAPLWLLARGILLSEPFTVAALLSLAPIVTYIFQGFDNRIHWSVASAGGCAIVAAFTVYSTRMKYRGNVV